MEEGQDTKFSKYLLALGIVRLIVEVLRFVTGCKTDDESNPRRTVFGRSTFEVLIISSSTGYLNPTSPPDDPVVPH